MRFLRCIWLSLVLTFPALCAVTGTSQAWVVCGKEGGDCTMSSNGHNLVRYGANQSFFMVETQGVYKIVCNNDPFGDPAYKADKVCEWMPASPEKETFKRCSAEDQDCRLPDNAPRRVRYGGNGQWVFRIASGTFPCNNDRFPDVAPGADKFCEYSTTPYSLGGGSVSFQDCGTEDSGNCQVGDGTDPVLIRYGVDPLWIYSLGTTSSVRCGNETFGEPARGETKFCQVVTLPPQITNVVGHWVKAGDCQNCSSLSRQVQVGVSGSRQNSVTNSWTNSITVSIEGSLTFEGIGGAKTSVSATSSATEAKAVTDTVSRQQTETMTANCTSAPTEKLEMFQWRVDVDELCYVSGGQCQSKISQFRILCVHDQPNGFKPICPPSMCKDANCTQCQK